MSDEFDARRINPGRAAPRQPHHGMLEGEGDGLGSSPIDQLELERDAPEGTPGASFRGAAPVGLMKALTIWQPWASLIMIGAKPYEFRRWDYRERERALVGQRIVIHAGARPVRLEEVEDIIARLEDRISSLHADIAMPLLERLRAAYKCRGVVELASGLGTAIIGTPLSVAALFNSPADSDRIDHHMWAWPFTDIRPFAGPVPMRGAQGFWNWPEAIAA